MSAPPETTAPTPAPGRVVALDAFRGIAVAGMILVNNPGSWRHVYAPLRHAEWHGWTPTDLVFPAFLFIVGVAIPLALGKRVARGDPSSALVGKVVWRTAVIFGLGLALSAFPFNRPVATLRIPGVLQRIALCYGAAALIALYTRPRTQAALAAGLLLGYWALLTLVPVPGVGPGDLSRPNNLAAWLDRLVLSGHLYKKDYDPEGLLSTLPALATTLLGLFAGRWLASDRPRMDQAAGLFAAGAVALAAGAAWHPAFPVNKALWTSSFVLWSAGLSLQLLALCVWLIDALGYRRWAWPFLVFGSNAIAAFVLSGLLARLLGMVTVAAPSGERLALKTWLYTQGFASWAEPTFASFLYALAYVLFWLAALSLLYRWKLFIRV